MAVWQQAGTLARIWRMLLTTVISGDHFSIHILVQRGELYDRAFGVAILPLVEFHDDAVHVEEQVVIRFLQGVGDGI